MIYVFTEGSGRIKYHDNTINVIKGDTYLIPANMGAFRICGNLKFIKSYIPDIKSDIIQPLKDIGYDDDEIMRAIEGIDKHIYFEEY